MSCRILRSALFAVAMLSSAAANALLFRVYLASDGNDANACTLPAPCRLLPAALNAVADGGEVWMLDSANYNAAPVAITKSVTILAVPGALGSVVATGGNAIHIATAGVNVVLRNLVIVPLPGGGGQHGIYLSAGDRLTVEDCLVAGLPQSGIYVEAGASVRVTGSTIRDNATYGILLSNGARGSVTRSLVNGNGQTNLMALSDTAGTTSADIVGSTFASAIFGVYALSTHASGVVQISLRDSNASGNSNYGVVANSTAGAAAVLSASSNLVANNGTGIAGLNAGARVWVSGNTVTSNDIGFESAGNGVFESAGDNAVRANSAETLGPITPIARK
jgi:parallel beta-helix repeat protein